MRKTVLLVLAGIFLCVSLASSAQYLASKRSNKYHYPTCMWAAKIKKENLIVFRSPEEAKNEGYVPCKLCKPPLSSDEEE